MTTGAEAPRQYLVAFAALAASVVSACSVGERAEPRVTSEVNAFVRDFSSGSRLRARYASVDGVVVWTDFFDTVLGEPCSFVDPLGAHVAPGGAYYCLPTSIARHRLSNGPYADNACKTPISVPPGLGETAASFALLEPTDACASAPVVRRALPIAKRRIYLPDGTGRCGASSTTVAVQPLGEEVPLSTFVRATERIEPRGGRIAARTLVGEDGSRLVVGGFDLVRGDAVRAGTADDRIVRWVPSRVAFHGTGDDAFAETSCTTQVATKVARDALCPLTAALVFDGACGAGAFYSLGPAPAGFFQRTESGQCVAAASDGRFAFTLGAKIPSTAFPEAVPADQGSGRVRRRGFGSVGSEVVAWTGLVDTTFGPCGLSTAADGVERCLPTATAAVTAFADASCTEPAFVRAEASCDVGTEPRFVRDEAAADAAHVYEVVGTVGALFVRSGRGCAAFKATGPVAGRRVREVGPESFVASRAVSE